MALICPKERVDEQKFSNALTFQEITQFGHSLTISLSCKQNGWFLCAPPGRNVGVSKKYSTWGNFTILKVGSDRCTLQTSHMSYMAIVKVWGKAFSLEQVDDSRSASMFTLRKAKGNSIIIESAGMALSCNSSLVMRVYPLPHLAPSYPLPFLGITLQYHRIAPF